MEFGTRRYGSLVPERWYDSETTADESSDGLSVEFSISSPPSSRVTVDDLTASWEVGDKMLFYNKNSVPTTTSSYTTLSISEVDAESGVAKFSGTLPAALGGGYVSGFYPASGVFLNKGSADTYKQLRLVQPGYIQYEYENGKITPESMAQYSYISICSDEMLFTTSTTDVKVLSATANYVLAYMDLNLKNPNGKVKRAYISMSEPLTYESIQVGTTGAGALDKRLNYCESETGASSFDDYLSFQLDYMVVEMSNSSDGSLGVEANGESDEVQMRIPLIPQSLSGTWTVIVEYTDNDYQDLFTVDMTGVMMERGVVYSHGASKDLSSEAVRLEGADRLPKMGDLIDADGFYGTTKANMQAAGGSATPVGIVYDVKGVGTELAVASAYRLTTEAKTVLNTAYANDEANTSAEIRNAHFTGTFYVSNGFDLMQTYIDIVNDEALDLDSLYENPLASLRGLGYTNDYILSQISPAYAAAWAQNSTEGRPEAPYTGDERGWWYLPSLGEVYHMIYQTQMLQSHGTYFFSEREAEMSADGVTATTLIPTISAVTNILTASTWETLSGGVWGVAYAKNYNLYNLTPKDAGSTDSTMAALTYISAGCSKYVTTQTYPMRTIINY